MAQTTEQKRVVIKFAGDSGDGMQLTGGQFAGNTALIGNDLNTFPDFPAEIRAPQGTTAGVSGYQIHFGSEAIFTSGDNYDVLVAMNAAALKKNIAELKKGGVLIINEAGFDSKNLRLAHYEQNPLDSDMLEAYQTHRINISKLTREALKPHKIGTKDKERSKNMFVLGFLFWLYNRDLDSSVDFLKQKFAKKPDIMEANIAALQAGYNFGDISQAIGTRYYVAPAQMPKGTYRSITGNHGAVLGLIAAAQKAELPLFYGSYPITPASDILNFLAKYKNHNTYTFQAEDEIAAVCTAIGASFGGALGVTGTSGPGMALKGEAIGLAAMIEIPLVVINVQRAGPSTGLPTKTEQADLMQALYGRNGECPLPIFSISKPADAFNMAFEAARIAIQHRTPVILLSDGYIANGTEPWRFPKASDIPKIDFEFAKASPDNQPFLPYSRDENLVRPWAIPGIKGLEHRLGGLEKQELTGNVSYNPDNHQKMVKIRAEKVDKIADNIPLQHINTGVEKGKVLVLGWGSTYGSIKSAVRDLIVQGHQVGHAQLSYIQPFPKNLSQILANFDKILVPEINNGQLITLIRDKFLIDAIPYNKIKGVPITKNELKDKILEILG